MDVIELLETPWQPGVSILEISSVGQDFIDITECVNGFDVSIVRYAGMLSAQLSFWHEAKNINTTKQHIFRIGEMFQYKLYPYGKDAPYCEGSMLFRRHSSILEFKLSGEPRLKNL
ncbi:MAG: hypothetical protein OXI62_12270 [Chloroflexota bacterium]|nr:hypothetical protein [Chloroflexota bacterium]